MNKLKEILKDKRLETWAWESINSLIVIAIIMLSEINITDNPYLVIIIGAGIGLLNQLTKYINIRYLK